MRDKLNILIDEYHQIFYSDKLSYDEFKKLSVIYNEKILNVYDAQERIKTDKLKSLTDEEYKHFMDSLEENEELMVSLSNM